MGRTCYDYGGKKKLYKILIVYAKVKRVISLPMYRVSCDIGSDEDLDGLVGSITKWGVF
jgi:hypothetical protein